MKFDNKDIVIFVLAIALVILAFWCFFVQTCNGPGKFNYGSTPNFEDFNGKEPPGNFSNGEPPDYIQNEEVD